MNFMITAEPTQSNIEYFEAVNDLYMDYEHHFINDDELERELNKLSKQYGGNKWDIFTEPLKTL